MARMLKANIVKVKRSQAQHLGMYRSGSATQTGLAFRKPLFARIDPGSAVSRFEQYCLKLFKWNRSGTLPQPSPVADRIGSHMVIAGIAKFGMDLGQSILFTFSPVAITGNPNLFESHRKSVAGIRDQFNSPNTLVQESQNG